MLSLLSISITLISTICICNSSVNSSSSVSFNRNLKDTVSKPPEFKDGGKAAENLKNVYLCEVIEYENWEDDDAADDELTVCLINSNKVPNRNPDESAKEFERIASQIKKAVKNPERYQAYYIIFVKSKTHPQPELSFKSHVAGMKVSAKRLK